MRNSMMDLRNMLFETAERLLNPEPETPMTTDTAKAMVDVAKTLIDSARVENEYLSIVAELNPGAIPDMKSDIKAIGGWIGSPVRPGNDGHAC